MAEIPVLHYTINDPVELNLAYMPFINGGGLFIPSEKAYPLGTHVVIELLMPGHKDSLRIEGKVVWITPPNALYQVLSGMGVQLTGAQAAIIRSQIEAGLDKTMEIGGYTLGTPSGNNKQ
ncbi:MAG TPA: PilZ domain-containing protein [Gammaproteobacteria bacterium]|nr:PilZ domain-containing protein [Gammaproteobacteria bacterium]